MTTEKQGVISYQQAGVDIDKGNAFVETVKTEAKATMTPGVLSGIGGFAACFELDLSDTPNPVLCACTDGVGTKLKLAQELNNHHTIGIDLVAMCANDLIVNGAKPLFFLDYYATGKLHAEQSAAIIKGIADGCKQANMSLIGGETAEMPGFYEGHSYDLAGFSVGVVDKTKMIDGSQVRAGDKLIGLASSGLHSNGYSLIRKLLEVANINLAETFAGQTLGELLLMPTRIYVRAIQTLLHDNAIHAMAHITGGGLAENLARVLPKQITAQIQLNSWQKPVIYQWLDGYSQIEMSERLRTFNEGLGMVLCVDDSAVTATLANLEKAGEKAWLIGDIVKGTTEQPTVELI